MLLNPRSVRSWAALLAVLCACDEEAATKRTLGAEDEGRERATSPGSNVIAAFDAGGSSEVAPGAGGELGTMASGDAAPSVDAEDAHVADGPTQLTCAPGASLGCTGGDAVLVCSADGTSSFGQSCPTASPVCVEPGHCSPCSESACADNGTLRKCTDAGWVLSACEASQTCVQGPGGSECTGECRAGTSSCNPTTHDLETCSSVGALQIGSCSPPYKVCRPDGAVASCTDAPRFKLGNSDASEAAGWERFTPNQNRVYFVPLTTAKESFLSALLLTGSGQGGSCRMSLYEGADGQPWEKVFGLLTSTAVTPGTTGHPPQIVVKLKAGVSYWVAATCGTSTSGTPTIWRKAVAGQRYYEKYIALFTDFVPNTILPEDLTLTTGTALSFFAEAIAM